METILAFFTIIGGAVAIYQIPQVSNFFGEIYYSIPGTIGRTRLNPCLSASTATLSIVKKRPKGRSVTVRAIATEAELQSLYQIDSTAYGEADIGYEQFLSWWLAHRFGLYAIFDASEQVIGAIGIWPIPKEFCEKLSNGLTSEKELTAEMISKASRRFCSSWYISGIVLKHSLRRTTLAAQLIVETITQWCFDHKIQYPVKLFAIAYSVSGQALLSRFDFGQILPSSRSLDGFAVYSRIIHRGEFKAILKDISP